MGLFDAIMGRRKLPKPNLDQLFGLPGAALTLEVSTVFRPTGVGSVAFRAPEGRAFADLQRDVEALVSMNGEIPIEISNDEYGYTWVTVTSDPPDMAELVTSLHAVNISLTEGGFGATLLCTLVSFVADSGRQLALVYLFKQGTFYPFAPDGDRQRDNITELQVRDLVSSDLRVEPDLTRWFAVWGAPGMG